LSDRQLYNEEDAGVFWKNIFGLVLLGLLLAACSGQATANGHPNNAAVGDPAAGETLFKQGIIKSAPGCINCHSIGPVQAGNGPSLYGEANIAGTRVKGQSAEEYLRTSILDPDAYIVQGFPSGIMYQDFKDVLTDQQVNDLVAYLMTLK
jgi:mono/diheme cytochrome c family protein